MVSTGSTTEKFGSTTEKFGSTAETWDQGPWKSVTSGRRFW